MSDPTSDAVIRFTGVCCGAYCYPGLKASVALIAGLIDADARTSGLARQQLQRASQPDMSGTAARERRDRSIRLVQGRSNDQP